MQNNIFLNFEQELTKHVIKVNYLINSGWSYNEYSNKFHHNSYTKKYIEKLTPFEESLSHLYCNDTLTLNDFSIDEANKVQKQKDKTINWKQLSLKFDDEEYRGFCCAK